MLRKLGTVSGLTLASRLLGFLRDMVLAATLGAGPVADAFMLAFRLPNHFRAILAEGAFNAAFLPTYAAAEAGGRGGRELGGRGSGLACPREPRAAGAGAGGDGMDAGACLRRACRPTTTPGRWSSS